MRKCVNGFKEVTHCLSRKILCHLSVFKQGSTLGKGTTGLLYVRESAGPVSMFNQNSNDIQEMNTFIIKKTPL